MRVNIPVLNMLLENKYKTRALLDSGSSTTVLTTGLLAHMPDLKKKLRKTSLTYSGVS